MTQIDTRKLTEIADRNPTSEAFFTYAACRARNARDGVTPLRAIRQQMAKEGFHPVPQDLLTMFRELERAGVGTLTKGQFKWNVSIKDVGESATTTKPQPKKVAVPVVATIPSATKTLIMHFGHNKEASITFTPNLGKEDVAFLVQKLLAECK